MKKFTRGFIAGAAGMAICAIAIALLLSGCGDQGSQGPIGLPGTTIGCQFFCHGHTKLYIRCDGRTDVVVTVKTCHGVQG